MAEPQNPVPGPVRETFHGEFFRRAEQFVKDALVMIPELEGVAVVPSWEVRQDRLPYGIVMGRNGPLQTPQEIVHMGEQLHGVLRTVVERSFLVLRSVDARLGQMAEEIRVKQSELDRLNAALAGHGPADGESPATAAAQGSAPGGAAPGDPG